jgi:argininosuccinate lyase
MGAAAITTTGFPISRERVAELLGFARVQENSYGCIAAVDQLAAAYSALRILFLNIGRLTQDLAFWTSFEVGQARAPDGFVQVSSIMPQKRNPLAVEHLRTMASLGAGHCGTVLGALHNTPFADMVDAEGPTQSAGHAAFDMAGRVLPLLAALLDGLTIDAARVRANTDASCATMTELADSLVRLEGLPSATRMRSARSSPGAWSPPAAAWRGWTVRWWPRSSPKSRAATRGSTSPVSRALPRPGTRLRCGRGPAGRARRASPPHSAGWMRLSSA